MSAGHLIIQVNLTLSFEKSVFWGYSSYDWEYS